MSLTCSNLSYTYPGAAAPAFSGLELTLNAGDILGIEGPCASGKSTLLACLSGALEPSTGSIRINGRMTENLPDRKRLMAQRVALVQQLPERQFFATTVYDEVAFGPRNLGFDEDEVAACVAEALQEAGLDPNTFKDRHPFALSGGEQRRLAIASMLALKPQYLLLDEPSVGLDTASYAQLLVIVQELAAQGMGILIVSHDHAFLQRSFAQVVTMDELQASAPAASTEATAPQGTDEDSASAGFGVYVPGDSFMHGLDPRVKIVLSLVFIVAAFAASSYLGLSVVAAGVIAMLALSNTTNAQIVRSLKPFAWLMVFVLVFNSIFATGGVVEAIEQLVRFVLVVLGTSMLMRTTAPTELADGTALLLKPLNRLGIKTDKASLAIQLTLRFVPTITQEFNRIKQAQEARLAHFDSKSPYRRVKAYIPVMVPLLAGALRRSDTLALAIQNREYGQHPGVERSCLRVYRLTSADVETLCAAALLLVLALVL